MIFFFDKLNLFYNQNFAKTGLYGTSVRYRVKFWVNIFCGTQIYFADHIIYKNEEVIFH